MTNYKLYPKAQSDLQTIWNYTVKQWGLNQAAHYFDGLEDTFELLAAKPLIARERHDFDPPVRIYPYSHHLIVYFQKDNAINIIRILHERMNISAKLNK